MLKDVRAFREKFGMFVHDTPGHLTERALWERHAFLLEELVEFRDAIELQDLAAQADALVDLVYVALGTALMLGLPWEELWNDVQRANLMKVRGMTKRGNAVDVAKPVDWIGPLTHRILRAAGYNQSDRSRKELHRDNPNE